MGEAKRRKMLEENKQTFEPQTVVKSKTITSYTIALNILKSIVRSAEEDDVIILICSDPMVRFNLDEALENSHVKRWIEEKNLQIVLQIESNRVIPFRISSPFYDVSGASIETRIE